MQAPGSRSQDARKQEPKPNVATCVKDMPKDVKSDKDKPKDVVDKPKDVVDKPKDVVVCEDTVKPKEGGTPSTTSQSKNGSDQSKDAGSSQSKNGSDQSKDAGISQSKNGSEQSKDAGSPHDKATRGEPASQTVAVKKEKRKLMAWTPEEHQRFVYALEKLRTRDTEAVGRNGELTCGLGPGIAEVIALAVGTRNAAQVRSHAQKHFTSQRRAAHREFMKAI